MLPYMVIGVPHWSGNTWQGNTVYIYQISELFWRFTSSSDMVEQLLASLKPMEFRVKTILKTDSMNLKSS